VSSFLQVFPLQLCKRFSSPACTLNGDVEFLDILNLEEKSRKNWENTGKKQTFDFLQLKVNTTSRTDVRNIEKCIVLLHDF
jgi:hypothetical protein